MIPLKKSDYDIKIEEIEKKLRGHNKYITTNDFNKFSGAMFEERLKQIKLATNNDLNTVQQNAARNKEKLEKLQTFELSYFHGKKYFDDDGFQSMLVYRPKFSKMLLLGN